MYVLNFVALIICALAAIWQGINGNVGLCLIEIALVLINLPYAIKWFVEFLR